MYEWAVSCRLDAKAVTLSRTAQRTCTLTPVYNTAAADSYVLCLPLSS
jgi:hypothetical protein